MITIREASFNDYHGIKILQNHYGIPVKNLDEWQNIWKNNPVIADIKDHCPMGWVIENNNKQIAGYIGNIPIAYEFKGKRLIAAAASSFVVDAGYRNYSISLANTFFSQKCADMLLMITPIYEAGKVYSAFRAQRVPDGSYNTFLFWIINYQKFISSAFIKLRLPLSCIIKYPLSFTMWGVDKLIKRNRYINPLNKKIQHCIDFDERFDMLWDNLRKKYYNRLLCVRNAEYLNWHFKYAIAHKKIWIFTYEMNSQIIGYAIFLREDNPEIGLRRVRLVDLQSIDEDPDALMEMVSNGIKRCQNENIHILEVIGFNYQKRSIMKQYSPYRRKLPSWPFLYKVKDELLAKELKDHRAWDPSLFDGDASM